MIAVATLGAEGIASLRLSYSILQICHLSQGCYGFFGEDPRTQEAVVTNVCKLFPSLTEEFL
jgi:hypothetical protein